MNSSSWAVHLPCCCHCQSTCFSLSEALNAKAHDAHAVSSTCSRRMHSWCLMHASSNASGARCQPDACILAHVLHGATHCGWGAVLLVTVHQHPACGAATITARADLSYQLASDPVSPAIMRCQAAAACYSCTLHQVHPLMPTVCKHGIVHVQPMCSPCAAHAIISPHTQLHLATLPPTSALPTCRPPHHAPCTALALHTQHLFCLLAGRGGR